ncbi:MAG: TIGR03086 family metal-binding protein [Streptosporangiaceae bacterium]
MHDLTPATQMLSRVVMDVQGEQLDAPTPDGDATVADLLDHVNGLSQAFTAAAAKDVAASRPPSAADGSRLPPDWRVSIPERLARLAAAWQSEPAWIGMTKAGDIDMPGEVAASVATNEVLVHGWDLAAATGHDFAADPGLVGVATAFVEPTARQNPDGVPGLFGPVVAVPDGVPPLDRLIGLTGRDPAWRPAG